jgi:hypothetical protein
MFNICLHRCTACVPPTLHASLANEGQGAKNKHSICIRTVDSICFRTVVFAARWPCWVSGHNAYYFSKDCQTVDTCLPAHVDISPSLITQRQQHSLSTCMPTFVSFAAGWPCWFPGHHARGNTGQSSS